MRIRLWTFRTLMTSSEQMNFTLVLLTVGFFFWNFYQSECTFETHKSMLRLHLVATTVFYFNLNFPFVICFSIFQAGCIFDTYSLFLGHKYLLRPHWWPQLCFILRGLVWDEGHMTRRKRESQASCTRRDVFLKY